MTLKDGVEPGSSSSPWYDIIEGGYFNPENYLDSQKDIFEVNTAIAILSEYKDLVVEEI